LGNNLKSSPKGEILSNLVTLFVNKKSFTPRVLIAFDNDPLDAVDVLQDVLDDFRHGLVNIKRDFIFLTSLGHPVAVELLIYKGRIHHTLFSL
jgi:hypothetical protein